MKTTDYKFVGVISELLMAADAGRLTLQRLRETWPSEADGITFFDMLYDDILDAVEHFPGCIITGEPNSALWQSLYEHALLRIDIELLTRDEDLSVLLSERLRA